jgi:hypothetical protein
MNIMVGDFVADTNVHMQHPISWNKKRDSLIQTLRIREHDKCRRKLDVVDEPHLSLI